MCSPMHSTPFACSLICGLWHIRCDCCTCFCPSYLALSMPYSPTYIICAAVLTSEEILHDCKNNFHICHSIFIQKGKALHLPCDWLESTPCCSCDCLVCLGALLLHICVALCFLQAASVSLPQLSSGQLCIAHNKREVWQGQRQSGNSEWHTAFALSHLHGAGQLRRLREPGVLAQCGRGKENKELDYA